MLWRRLCRHWCGSYRYTYHSQRRTDGHNRIWWWGTQCHVSDSPGKSMVSLLVCSWYGYGDFMVRLWWFYGLHILALRLGSHFVLQVERRLRLLSFGMAGFLMVHCQLQSHATTKYSFISNMCSGLVFQMMHIHFCQQICIFYCSHLPTLRTTNSKWEQCWFMWVTLNLELCECCSMAFDRLTDFSFHRVQLHCTNHTVLLK